ncbi:MAG TPA: LuxR C-terminal-related transcriptional regulator [Streptosporangiaceae bacterium]|nr:LuxR C-terminal-related transcriptional regulator [Streptosporangiaceae bacterium]
MVNSRISVYIYAHDPITKSGLTAQLRGRPEFELVDGKLDTPPKVALLAIDTADEQALQVMRGLRVQGCEHLVLVVSSLSDEDLMAVVEAGAGSIVWRSRASASWLAQTIINAAGGEAALPPEALARLLKQVTRLRRHVLAPRGLTFNGLSSRERDILKLAAEGFDTDEIARELSYSKRTVTSALHDVSVRYQLRNRTHAVAYAIREGFI